MKKHKVAVVGCGALAQRTHLPHCKDNPRIELVATCDINENAAQSCKETFGAARAETDWRKLIQADDIDLFLLATHTNLRGEFILPALEAGKPVYTEKPLAPSIHEMMEIVKATRRTGVSVCVGHNRRSSPAVLEMKRLTKKAVVANEVVLPSIVHDRIGGKIPEELQMQMLMRVCDDARTWKQWVFSDEEGIFFAEMVHFIDLALWFNKSHPIRVFAEGSNRGNFTQIIRFQDGSITTIQHTMVGSFDYPKELFEVTTNNVTVAMDQHIEVRQCGLLDEPTLQTFPFGKGAYTDGQGMTVYMQAVQQERDRAHQEKRPVRFLDVEKGHYAQLDRFLTHIEGNGENPCDVESAVQVCRITMKLLESSRSGMPVVINPEDWHIPF